MALLMLRSSGFHGYPYAKELRVPWLSLFMRTQLILYRLECCYNYKGKYHFYEMKGDVGMSSHEKEREQEDALTQTQICFFQDNNEFHVANSM